MSRLRAYATSSVEIFKRIRSNISSLECSVKIIFWADNTLISFKLSEYEGGGKPEKKKNIDCNNQKITLLPHFYDQHKANFVLKCLKQKIANLFTKVKWVHPLSYNTKVTISLGIVKGETKPISNTFK